MDDELDVWRQFLDTVVAVAAADRPELTVAGAHREALEGWVAEQQTLYNRDRPFPPVR